MTVATTLRLVSQVMLYVTTAVGAIVSLGEEVAGHFGLVILCRAVPPIVSSKKCNHISIHCSYIPTVVIETHSPDILCSSK